MIKDASRLVGRPCQGCRHPAHLRRTCAAVALAALLLGCHSESAPPHVNRTGIKIGVVPMGTTHDYWRAVHAGALRAASEAGVELLWPTPFADGDLASQLDAIYKMRAAGARAIAIAPITAAIGSTVNDLESSGMRVLIFDSGLTGHDDVPFVGSNNYDAGRLAGAHMVRALKGEGGLVVMRPQLKVASAEQRVQGFLDAIDEARTRGSRLNVIAQKSVGASLEESFVESHAILEALHARTSGSIKGIFCPNESSTIGMSRAIQNLGLTGKIHLVGFDSSPMLAHLLEGGKISALVLQDPNAMGRLSVATLVRVLRGEAVKLRVFTPATIATHEDATLPSLRRLLSPDLTLNRY